MARTGRPETPLRFRFLPKTAFDAHTGYWHWTGVQVQSIRSAQGTYPQVARHFGVSPTLIGKIKRRKLWKHL